ncbi:MAG: DUF3592 domain-containing protein [Aeromicrobium sp.]
MTVIALALIVVGVFLTSWGTVRLMVANGGSRAQGKILGGSTTGNFLDPHKEASFTFTAKDGVEHSVWSPTATGTGPEVGRTVQVRYDAANPTDARVVPPMIQSLWFFGFGDVLLIGGILLLVL